MSDQLADDAVKGRSDRQGRCSAALAKAARPMPVAILGRTDLLLVEVHRVVGIVPTPAEAGDGNPGIS